jgi:hypothetical protein
MNQYKADTGHYVGLTDWLHSVGSESLDWHWVPNPENPTLLAGVDFVDPYLELLAITKWGA